MLAFQARQEPEIAVAGFFDCNITISEVEGAYDDNHKLNDTLAKVAAGSITFGGPKNATFSDGTAYQLYPNK